MYDSGKIIGGVIVFVCVVTFPIWYAVANGKAGYVPQPQIDTQAQQCIEPTQYMRDNHMQLLVQWRETVVRTGERTYVATDNRVYDMSLTGTCLQCHPNKAQFCDQCHNYTGVSPNCWDCHNLPESGQTNGNQ